MKKDHYYITTARLPEKANVNFRDVFLYPSIKFQKHLVYSNFKSFFKMNYTNKKDNFTS